MTIVRKVPLGCYLTSSEIARLRAYAEGFELSAPSLCRLIVQRELEARELGGLKLHYLKKVGKEDGDRFTARFANRRVKDRFLAHARQCGLGSDDAVGILFRAEPIEQRLRHALGFGIAVESDRAL